jgi:hypothetical protein
MVAYSIFVLFCRPSNGFVNIKLAYIIAINGWILTSTIIWLSGTFLSSYAHYKCHFIFLFIVMPRP